MGREVDQSVTWTNDYTNPDVEPYWLQEKKATPIILCGNTCGHDHESLNGPTGCCLIHGPYMYFCHECHEIWREKSE